MVYIDSRTLYLHEHVCGGVVVLGHYVCMSIGGCRSGTLCLHEHVGGCSFVDGETHKAPFLPKKL